MENLLNSAKQLQSATLTARSTGPVGSDWKVGQTLQALVKDQPTPGRFILQIGQQNVEVSAQRLSLQVGQRLTLTVAADGPPLLLRATLPNQKEGVTMELTRLLRSDALPRDLAIKPGSGRAIASDVTFREVVIANAARNVLPRQTSITPLLEKLTALPPELRNTPVGQAAVRLLEQLPTPAQLSRPVPLRQAVQDSGLFFDATAAKNSVPPNDLKNVLMHLASAIRASLNVTGGTRSDASESANAQRSGGAPQGTSTELLPELARQTEGSIARLQLHQLATVNRQAEEPAWVLELPVRTPQGFETLEMQIRREKEGGHGEGGTSAWSVTLTLTPAEHGPIQITVTLRGQEVSAIFRMESEATAQLFRTQLDKLQQQFTDAGLEIGQVGSYSGLTPLPDPILAGLSSTLDEKA